MPVPFSSLASTTSPGSRSRRSSRSAAPLTSCPSATSNPIVRRHRRLSDSPGIFTVWGGFLTQLWGWPTMRCAVMAPYGWIPWRLPAVQPAVGGRAHQRVLDRDRLCFAWPVGELVRAAIFLFMNRERSNVDLDPYLRLTLPAHISSPHLSRAMRSGGRRRGRAGAAAEAHRSASSGRRGSLRQAFASARAM